MEYRIIKLKFNTPLHYTIGNRESSRVSEVILSDSIYSAICSNEPDEIDNLFLKVSEGNLRISDAFVYNGINFFIPKKPIIIEDDMNLDYKLLKKMNYISSKSIAIINSIENKNIEDEIKTYSNSFIIDTIEKNKVSRNLGEETIPFSFDVVRFKEGCGLYIVVEYKTIEDYDWMRERFANLGFTGIGGMVSAGYGKFEISDIIAETIYYISTIKRLKYGKNLLLSTAVSKNINKSFLDNSFELVKRSGFISSVNFTNGVLKKKLVYAIKSGALFDDKFEGDILDVAPIKGNHPIYRFLLPLFIEV